MIPTWRIPPPEELAKSPRLADRLVRASQGRADRGPRPLEKQIETVSKYCAQSVRRQPLATTAFISRAPSRCMARFCSRAQRAIAAMLAIG